MSRMSKNQKTGIGSVMIVTAMMVGISEIAVAQTS